MPSFCTVCGVKLTAKNKVTYRPSSCKPCELERKRLYSEKRKKQKELDKATNTSTNTKETKASTKVVVGKSNPEKKVKITTTSSKATKSKTIKSIETKVKTETKKVVAVKTTPKSKVSKTKVAVVKNTVESKPPKAKTPTKVIEKSKPVKEAAKKSTTAKKDSKDNATNHSLIIPDTIKKSAKTKIKTRRVKVNKANIASANDISAANSDSLSNEAQLFGLDKNEITEDDLLRAPTKTPWEDSSNFKVIGGSFINQGIEESEETRGPSPEEIQSIIEKIREEHKTRRS